MSVVPAEFSLIARHFKPLAGNGSLGLTDDAAVVTPPSGRELVISADAMVQGVHFLPDDKPDLVARKLLRTNLSDLAAMGAAPWAYLLTVSAPRDTPDTWFAGFAAGLAHDQCEYGISLLGGDTTSTPGPISLSVTILGTVAAGQAIRRSTARDGDGIWVSGTIGDGALGLLAATGRHPDPTGFLADRYRLPRPRLGLACQPWVNAAMDVSDGLVQDLGHLCRESGLAAELHAGLVPLSDPAHADALVLCLTGGDDYELLMAVAPAHAVGFQAHAAALGLAVTRVGRFLAGVPDVTLLDAQGHPMTLPRTGWSHFA
jgi:thiamine-monophosphate kinase